MMTDTLTAAIRDTCRQIWGAYALAIDQADAAGVVAQFTANGALVRGDTVMTGPDEIGRIVEGRAADMVMRHLVTTTDLRVARDGQSAEGTAYYLLYTARGSAFPLGLTLPFSLGDWYSRFVATPEGWRLERHEVRRLFMRAAD